MDFCKEGSSFKGNEANQIQEENNYFFLDKSNHRLIKNADDKHSQEEGNIEKSMNGNEFNENYDILQKSWCRPRGRTGRKRLKHKCECVLLNKTILVDSDPVLVKLCQWLRKFRFRNSVIPDVELRAAIFSDTGRGLKAMKNVPQGSKLVSIPKEALVTCRTAVSDPVLGPLLRKNKNKIRAMDVLTLFLVYHKNIGKESSWFPYIASLPKDYSVPLYCTKDETQMLPRMLQNIIDKQYEDIKQSEESLKYILEEILVNVGIKLHENDIKWGWFTVNTRSVYLKNDDLLCDILSDEDVYALAPYLDLLNHTHTAEVTTGLNLVNQCYEILTEVSYKKHEQVFINYGPHDNLKLYTEYGFILPDNPHANVPVNFEDLITVMKKFECDLLRQQMIYEKTQILKKNEMITNVCVSRNGPSWNLEALVSILLMTPAEIVHWQEVFNDLNNMVHRNLVINFLEGFVVYILKIWKEIEICLCEKKNSSDAFSVSKELVKDYCFILELCLEEWFSTI